MRRKIWRILVCVPSHVQNMFWSIYLSWLDFPGCFLFDLLQLGKLLSILPVDPKLGKMLIMGAIFHCFDPILTIVSGLSVRDPFLLPQEKKDVSIKFHGWKFFFLFLSWMYWLVDDLMIPCFILVSFISQVEILSERLQRPYGTSSRLRRVEKRWKRRIGLRVLLEELSISSDASSDTFSEEAVQLYPERSWLSTRWLSSQQQAKSQSVSGPRCHLLWLIPRNSICCGKVF